MTAADPDGPPPYRLYGKDVLDRLLATDPDEALEWEVWLWLSGLLWKPDQHPSVLRQASVGEERRSAVVPGTRVGISYLVWASRRSVALVAIADLDE